MADHPVHIRARRDFGLAGLVDLARRLIDGAVQFIRHQQNALSEIQRRKGGVHRDGDDGVGADDVVILQACAFAAEEEADLFAPSGPRQRVLRGGFGRHHQLGHLSRARGGRINVIEIRHRLRRRRIDARLVQHPSGAGGERDRPGVGPAVTRIHHPHPTMPEIPHRPRGGADVFPHLGFDQNECRIGHAFSAQRLVSIAPSTRGSFDSTPSSAAPIRVTA